MNKRGNTLTINAPNANQRLDKFLLKYWNKAEKNLVYKLLRKKRVKLNGGKAEGSELLKEGDVLTFYISPETMAGLYAPKVISEPNVPPRVKHGAGSGTFSVGLNIIFEDENVLIVDKPAGLLTHSDDPVDTDTLIDYVIAYLHEKGEFAPAQGVFTPVCCNRLDRNTSGIITCAKNLQAAQALNAAFKQRETVKIYTAVVCGNVANKLTISTPIDGRDALTEVTPISCGKRNGESYTVVKIRLHTGRTHQIRIHMQSVGHPIVGDRKYGYTGKRKGQLLHASELVVLNKHFKAELPKGFSPYYEEKETYK